MDTIAQEVSSKGAVEEPSVNWVLQHFVQKCRGRISPHFNTQSGGKNFQSFMEFQRDDPSILVTHPCLSLAYLAGKENPARVSPILSR